MVSMFGGTTGARSVAWGAMVAISVVLGLKTSVKAVILVITAEAGMVRVVV